MNQHPDDPGNDTEHEGGSEEVGPVASGGGEPPGPEEFTEEFEAAFGDEFGADVQLGDEDEEHADAAGEGLTDEEEAVDEEEPADAAQPVDEEEPVTAGAGATDRLEVLSQDTVEADVLALGDEEEAREAAEREAAAESDADGVEDQETDADEAEEEAVAAAAVATAEGPPTAEKPGGPGGPEPEPEEGAPKAALWARFLTAALVIVISMATATSVSILLYLSDIAKGLGGLEGLQRQLQTVEGGDPQNILILGSDRRPELEEQGRSDTTMLLRLDPDSNAIALLSLPRDLKVNIPGRGVAKLNEAYTIGGPDKTLQVVKQLTGLNIHHVVNVDFEGFEKAINAIDCVYVDVDRRYFNSNEGVDPSEFFAEIDIKAGYQLLCGQRALQYVRYRHTDNDLVRGARQQDFLREARQKIGPTRLFRDREKLIDIFKKYTTSDIDNEFTMLDVLKTFLGAADAPVKQIHFRGTLGQSYVTASNTQIRRAVKQFLGFQDTPGALGGGKSDGSGGGKGKKKEKEEKRKPQPGGGGAPALIDSTGSGLAWAESFAPEVKFPVFYPTKLVPGSAITDESREYKIEDTDGKIHRAYKLVISIPGASVPFEYYGVMGTTWRDPPILANPTETREIGRREYILFYDGDRLRLVAWKTKKAAYWLNNTLGQTLEENEMLAIADSMRDLPAKR